MAAANTTDGLLNKLDVTVLKDDKHVFPPYQACIVDPRKTTLTAYPNLRGILSELSGKISDTEMRNMNYAVDAQHRPARDVAKEFPTTAPDCAEFLLPYPRNRPHQLPIGHLIQRREPDPLAVAPAGIVPARKQRQMLLFLREQRHHRLERRHQLA